MGQLRFRLHDRNRIAPEALSRIFVAGGDDIPWATRAWYDADTLVVERQVDESGYVHVPWEVSGAGRRLLCTSTLMERDEPYLLDVELARGLIHRLRSRLFIWEFMGLVTPPALRERLRDAVHSFATAATSQDNPAVAAKAANEAIATALALSVDLVRSYAEQTLAARQRQTPAATLLAIEKIGFEVTRIGGLFGDLTVCLRRLVHVPGAPLRTQSTFLFPSTPYRRRPLILDY